MPDKKAQDLYSLEKTLLIERDRLSAIIRAIGDGICVVDVDFRIILMNPIAEKFFRISALKAVGKNLLSIVRIFKKEDELVGNENPIAKSVKEMRNISAGLRDNLSISTFAQPDIKIPIGLIVSPLFSQYSVDGAVIILRDLTAENDLNKAKDEFIIIASHHLRTPLTSIVWHAELLLEEASVKKDKKLNTYMRELYNSSKELSALVDELLYISRIEAQVALVDAVPISLKDIVVAQLYRLKADISGKAITVLEEYDDPLPMIILDEELIKIVFRNILDNAIRYSGAEGKVDIKIKKKDEHALVIISDNGAGIPENQQGDVFTKFFRGDNAVLLSPTGKGLGLFIAKSIIEKFGGKIWFESQENKGTTFYFALPLNSPQ